MPDDEFTEKSPEYPPLSLLDLRLVTRGPILLEKDSYTEKREREREARGTYLIVSSPTPLRIDLCIYNTFAFIVCRVLETLAAEILNLLFFQKLINRLIIFFCCSVEDWVELLRPY